MDIDWHLNISNFTHKVKTLFEIILIIMLKKTKLRRQCFISVSISMVFVRVTIKKQSDHSGVLYPNIMVTHTVSILSRLY